MDNYILIGMPGAGKSTVGVVLAKRLMYRFVDSDLVIQERYGSVLQELIRVNGVDGFLELEDEVNASMQAARSIIATGGSAIYGRKAMEHLKQLGTVIYLRLPLDAVEGRLGDLDQRGVTLRKGQTLQDIYDERIPYYERYADITVECDAKSIREIVEEIETAINNRSAGEARK